MEIVHEIAFAVLLLGLIAVPVLVVVRIVQVAIKANENCKRIDTPQVELTCPYCHNHGLPFINKKISVVGWILFVVLLFLCLPLCWLPFVINSCHEEIRKCPSCGAKFG